MLEKEFVLSVSANYMKTCIMNTLIVIESLTIVNSLNKVQFPFVKVFPPQMLSSSSEGAIVQAVPIAFAPVKMATSRYFFKKCSFEALIPQF